MMRVMGKKENLGRPPVSTIQSLFLPATPVEENSSASQQQAKTVIEGSETDITEVSCMTQPVKQAILSVKLEFLGSLLSLLKPIWDQFLELKTAMDKVNQMAHSTLNKSLPIQDEMRSRKGGDYYKIKF